MNSSASFPNVWEFDHGTDRDPAALTADVMIDDALIDIVRRDISVPSNHEATQQLLWGEIFSILWRWRSATNCEPASGELVSIDEAIECVRRGRIIRARSRGGKWWRLWLAGDAISTRMRQIFQLR